MTSNASEAWHLVRIDDGGVPGLQHNLRATGNISFSAAELSAVGPELQAANSFLTLCAAYRGLDPAARHRVRVTYGTTTDQPRLQSMRCGAMTVHPPLRLPEGAVETWEFDIPASPAEDGRLTLTIDAHEIPADTVSGDAVAATAIVTRLELWADRVSPAMVLDAATVPRGGIVASVRRAPTMAPIVGARIAAIFADGTSTQLLTDDQGNACTVDPARTSRAAPGELVRLVAEHGHDCAAASVRLDDAFFADWPTLSPPASSADRIPLDGTWEFRGADGSWQPIEVPGQWFNQGFDIAPGTAATYRRRFETPAHAGAAVLRFDAVYAHAEITLNGEPLGSHEGGFTPFEFEVAALLADQNELTVCVRSDSISDTVSAASDYAAHSLGGITRSVGITLLPDAYLSRMHVDGTVDGAAGRARITGRISRRGGVATPSVRHLTATVLAPDQSIAAQARTEIPADDDEFDITVDVNDISPWTAETPRLYSVIVTVDGPESAASRRFGFRTVRVDGRQLTVNTVPIKLRGVERHEQDPLRGRSTLNENWRTDVELMKDANVNNVFTCHYPHAEGFLDECDTAGLWVIDESPTVWVDADNADDDDAFLAIAMPVLEMIERDRSHPSVIIWMLGDECLWGRNFWRLVVWLRDQGIDLPMMFSFDVGGESSLDIASRHYPPVEFGSAIADLDRPVTFDQFAHVNCYNRRELVTDPEVRDWWGYSFAPLWRAMDADDRVLGGQIWAWSDDEFHIDDGRVIGYGTWGIVDAWRRPKPEWWNLKMIYSPVRVGAIELRPGAMETVIPLENRYDFTDLSAITLEWSTPTQSGRKLCAGRPRSSGSVRIAFAEPLTESDIVTLRFFDAEGRLITVAKVYVGSPLLGVQPPMPEEVRPTVVTRERRAHLSAPNKPEFDAVRINNGPTEWLCDVEVGSIRAGRRSRRTIIEDGPALLILPADAAGSVGPHHRRDIRPRTHTLEGKTTSVRWYADPHELEATVEHHGATLAYRATFEDDGALTLAYDVTVHDQISVRQIGLVMDLPSSFDLLRWSRATQWSVYPDDHIGRPEGHARARRHHTDRKIPDRTDAVRPDRPWSADENSLGTADFRSTRRDIRGASLTDHSGSGVWVEPQEPTDIRAWIGDDRTRLLIATHTSGGSEPFLSHTGQSSPGRLDLVAGDTISGRFRLRLGSTTADSRAGGRSAQ